MLLMAIYYFVFAVVLRNRILGFAIFIVSGLLPWTAFAGAVTAASTSIVSNPELMKRCAFRCRSCCCQRSDTQ